MAIRRFSIPETEYHGDCHLRCRANSDLGRREEALRAKEEAIRTLSPFFVRHPDAFFPWTVVIVRTYGELLAELGREPDEQLLSPIAALLGERLGPVGSSG